MLDFIGPKSQKQAKFLIWCRTRGTIVSTPRAKAEAESRRVQNARDSEYHASEGRARTTAALDGIAQRRIDEFLNQPMSRSKRASVINLMSIPMSPTDRVAALERIDIPLSRGRRAAMVESIRTETQTRSAQVTNSTDTSYRALLDPSYTPPRSGGMVIGGPLNGTNFPGAQGGTIVGGQLNGSYLPGAQGGTVVGGPLNGSFMPGFQGGTIVGGPLNGAILPPRK